MGHTLIRCLVVLLLGLPTIALAQFKPPPDNIDIDQLSIEDLSMQVLIGEPDHRRAAVQRIIRRGGSDLIPTLVFFMRVGGEHILIAEALSALTGENIRTWREAMLWQEAHPEIEPHASYRDIKLRYLASIDERFLSFFDPELSKRERMQIRLEEIVWGGVLVDGIPALDFPSMVPSVEADYLLPDDLVFGVSINGDTRAYPLRILGWHEMFNDVVGGIPVALAYCTLCGSGILYETRVNEFDVPLTFGSSGLLYRSNKLMYDRQTRSLWNQFTGQPVVGELVDAGIQLKVRPVTITTWQDWREQHPDTSVLSLETGFYRDYGSGVVYRDYFASPDLMFPTQVGDDSNLRQKDYVFGVRTFAAAKAWPLAAFSNGPRVLNDSVGQQAVVLIGDADSRTVRAYQRQQHQFQLAGDGVLVSETARWLITEDALIGPAGEQLPRIPGHVSYWFAWDRFLGFTSERYQ